MVDPTDTTSDAPALRIAVIGAGAIGGYYGAKLAAAGNDVSFIARGATLAAIRDNGLRLVGREDLTLDVPVTDDAGTIGAVDVVMVCTKAWQVDDVCRQHLPALMGPHTLVITTQNGVSAHEVVAGIVGREHTCPGICREWTRIVEPGVIEDMGGPRSLHVNTYDDSPDPLMRAFRQAARRAGLDCPEVDDITTELWRKACNVAAHGAVGALLDAPLGVLLSDHRELLARCMDEWVRVANAHGARLPSTTVEDNLAFLDSQDPGLTTSFQRDITAGRPSEFAAQVGGLPALGDEVGVDTPVNDTIAAALGRHEQAVRAAGN